MMVSAGQEEPDRLEARFLWATRGRTWGFRFLRRGGYDDPLGVYEQAFSLIGDAVEGWCRFDGGGALRFRDPESREDIARRVIPHDFVLFGDLVDGIDSVETGRERIWPLVADEFGKIWDLPDPPMGS